MNPRHMADHRMYTCSLPGCKSAWGTSDDIFHHVTKSKHHKNFFRRLNPDDSRVEGLSGADILAKAAEWENEHCPDGKRDYTDIVRVEDYGRYMELRNRPDNWSEMKASLGMVGTACNMEPLGRKRAAGRGEGREEGMRSRREQSPMFDPAAWAGWRPATREEAVRDAAAALRTGVDDVTDLVDSFQGRKGDEAHQEIEHYADVYQQLLAILQPELAQETAGLLADLGKGRERIAEKLDGEDRTMKDITKQKEELEEEIKRYHSDRSTKKYENIQDRLGELTKAQAAFKPVKAENVELKAKHNRRLGEMWAEFETRSDSLVETLEQQMGEKARETKREDRKGEARKAAVEAYRLNLVTHVYNLLGQVRLFKCFLIS